MSKESGARYLTRAKCISRRAVGVGAAFLAVSGSVILLVLGNDPYLYDGNSEASFRFAFLTI